MSGTGAGGQRSDSGAGSFLSGFADIPLAPGIRDAPSSLSDFDTPEGRIVEAHATIPDAANLQTKEARSAFRIRTFAFYRNALPSLGWVVDAKNTTDTIISFSREEERLSVEWVETGDTAYLRFMLKSLALASLSLPCRLSLNAPGCRNTSPYPFPS